MGLDKLKKKKKPNQLVSKRKDGKRPGYYGSDAGFGDYDDSPSSSGGGDSGGGEGVYSPPAQSYTPAPSFDYESEAYDTTPAASYSEPDTSGDDQEDDVAQMMVDMGLTPDNAPTGFTPTTAEDDGDTGDSLYVSPTQTMKEQEPYIDYRPGPNYVTAQQLSNLERGLGDADQRAATFANIQAVNPIQKKGILQTIGSGLKTAAAIAAPILAPAFLPAVVAKPYTAFNQFRTVANLPSKFGLTKRRIPTLTQLVKNIPQGTGNRVPDKPTGYENDGDNRPIPKDIISANVQKFTPKQINSLQSNISLLESVLDSGQYRGTKLNTSQLSKISNQRNSLLEQYNMIQEYLV